MENQSNNASSVPPVTPTPPVSAPSSGPHKDTLMAVLAYIGPLVILSYLTKKEDPFVKFHIKQGAVLLIIEVALWILGSIVWILWPILPFIHLAVLILAIIGIINVVNGKEKALPLIGQFGEQIKI
jgi:uncharacterized membrane protein